MLQPQQPLTTAGAAGASARDSFALSSSSACPLRLRLRCAGRGFLCQIYEKLLKPRQADWECLRSRVYGQGSKNFVRRKWTTPTLAEFNLSRVTPSGTNMQRNCFPHFKHEGRIP